MKKLVLLFLGLALCCGGCATTKPKQSARPAQPALPTQPAQPIQPKESAEEVAESAGFLQRYAQSRRLSSAVSLIEKGDTAGAMKILETICKGKSAPGVTDEALFRLALLTMKPSTERPASPQGLNFLRRLKKEYPSSPWTVQAAPVFELVNSAEELRRQNRTYRSTNQALTREINELNKTIAERNKSIEQLKHLDMEIEKKTR